MNDYTLWVMHMDQQHEALQNAERRRLAKQMLAQRPQSNMRVGLPIRQIVSQAGLIVPILLALLDRR